VTATAAPRALAQALLGGALVALGASLGAAQAPTQGGATQGATQGATHAQEPAKNAAVTSLTIFAGTGDGFRRSRNWGSLWEPVRGKGLEDLGAVRAIVPMAPRVYLGGDGGLYISEDFGETWSRAYKDQPVLEIVPSRYPGADPTVFIATPRGLLRSDDAAKTFHPTPLGEGPIHRAIWPGPDLIVATSAGIRVSKDSGTTFLPSGKGLPEGRVAAIAASAFYSVDPGAFAGIAGGGVFRTADGTQNWTAAGLEGRTVNDLYWFGPILYAVTEAGVFLSDDAGLHWQARNEGLAGRSGTRILFPLAPVSGAEAFLGTDRGIFWTGDGGLHWRATGLADETILALATFPPPDQTVKKKK
jgi:hypothetical protein